MMTWSPEGLPAQTRERETNQGAIQGAKPRSKQQSSRADQRAGQGATKGANKGAATGAHGAVASSFQDDRRRTIGTAASTVHGGGISFGAFTADDTAQDHAWQAAKELRSILKLPRLRAFGHEARDHANAKCAAALKIQCTFRMCVASRTASAIAESRAAAAQAAVAQAAAV